MKFYEEVGCEHGWTDEKGFAHCDAGSACSIDLDCFCTREDCPICEDEILDTIVEEDEES
jgi:hypothetical protein